MFLCIVGRIVYIFNRGVDACKAHLLKKALWVGLTLIISCSKFFAEIRLQCVLTFETQLALGVESIIVNFCETTVKYGNKTLIEGIALRCINLQRRVINKHFLWNGH